MGGGGGSSCNKLMGGPARANQASLENRCAHMANVVTMATCIDWIGIIVVQEWRCQT